MKPRRRERFVPAYKARRRAREIWNFRCQIAEQALMQTMNNLGGLFSAIDRALGSAPVPPPDEGTPPALH